MRTNLPHSTASLKCRRQNGLTLLEMTVATALLVVIVLGLTAMFIQTQKAFRTGIKQVDVFEGGRAVADMIARDLEKLADCQVPGVTNFSAYLLPTNSAIINYEVDNTGNSVPFRTNRLEDVFAISHVNLDWTAVGYSVYDILPGVGTLYRYSPSAVRPATNLAGLYNEFSGTTNWMTNRVADGIVHLEVHAYDQHGIQIPYETNGTVVYYAWPADSSISTMPRTNPPRFLELELAILEPQIFEQARAMGGNAPTYLKSQAGKIHVFRRQIPIRGVIQ